ncbi:hypothetical protein [Micromonospora sp. NPDC005161]
MRWPTDHGDHNPQEETTARQTTITDTRPAADDPVLDGNGNPVPVPAFIVPDGPSGRS